MKDDSLEINILASNKCLYDRNVFQNGVNTFSKMVNHFLRKSSKICIWTIRFVNVQILPTCSLNSYQRMYGETLLVSALVMVT